MFGILLVVFASGLRTAVREGKLAWVSTGLLWLFALGPLLATFTLDPGSGPPTTWHGALHVIGFLLITLALIPTFFVFGWLFRRDPRWRGFEWYSVATGIVVVAVVFAPPTSSSNQYPIWTGPASMLQLVIECIWLEVIAIRLWQLTRRSVASV